MSCCVYRVHLDQSFVPLSSPSPGDLCAAKYTQDGRWYRGRVATPPRYNKVTIQLYIISMIPILIISIQHTK